MMNHLTHSGMFTDFYKFVREDYQVLADEISDELEQTASKHMRAISRDMRAAAVDKAETSKAKGLRGLGGRIKENVLELQNALGIATGVIGKLEESPVDR